MNNKYVDLKNGSTNNILCNKNTRIIAKYNGQSQKKNYRTLKRLAGWNLQIHIYCRKIKCLRV